MNKKKKVGIITMHRPISFGSALQAYALQKKITDWGYDCEIIDYKYPNKIHRAGQNRLKIFISYTIHYILNLFLGFPCLSEYLRFKNFRKKYLKLSSYYSDSEALANNPPSYDIYCTGSDQVWNSNFIKDDTSFLLSFVKAGKKISYAASFAIDYVPDKYLNNYQKYLSQYDTISVRESSGINLVNQLIGKSAIHACDPTLLLTKEEWFPLAEKSKYRINRPYLLVFILTYSYNPYPEVNSIIDRVQQQLGLHTIILNGTKADYFRNNVTVIKNAGPLEFLYLFKNASFIVTSSFHGVAFSINFEKPFLAVVKEDNHDSRLSSFLHRVQMEDKMVDYREKALDINLEICNYNTLNNFRNMSVEFLMECLSK